MVFYFGTIPPLVEKREVYAMQATLGCPRCSGRRIIKNGWLRGEQRYRCKDCSYNFVDPPKPDRPLVKKVLAILLYNLGLSFRATGKLCGVSGTTVLNWVDDFAEQHATKPAPSVLQTRFQKAVGVPISTSNQGWRWDGDRAMAGRIGAAARADQPML